MRAIWGIVLLALALPAAADVIEVEYSRFYSHVSKLDDEDTNALQFAFGFVKVGEGRLCEIRDANIVTDKKTLPLDVTGEYRFTVPTERALKLAEAVVAIDLGDPANQCDMSVQLETRPEYLKQEYSVDDLELLMDQYSAFFNEMGSFLSFMMPSVEGLVFQFEDDYLDAAVPYAPRINKGTLILSEEWLEDARLLRLPHAPMRVTAKTSGN
ncbi:DUF2987 domain-containing protein [Alteromonas halophila]|uniref:DUF2987 domain-containing protein n=1 Tax=Alteromonas halophila TaxID=516698 RepID=A0A918JMM1_9ALTE|nr:DUF2987 domain-containing protein [Alteromonas halophila]GGW88713.1 hypothetical protein GCM10007391_23660 [Alteromonas halophila]